MRRSQAITITRIVNIVFSLHSENKSWISRFCSRSDNCYFVEVEEDFITDAFNLYGINSDFHLYRQALSLILGDNDYRYSECILSRLLSM